MRMLHFLGAAETVTGSCFLISKNNTPRVLVDCGMFQGTPDIEIHNRDAFLFDPRQLEAVVLTHAHLDHVGRLPYLVASGFSGPIYATKPTFDLISITLMDSAKINHFEDGFLALYSRGDVEDTLRQVVTVDYGSEFKIGEFRVSFNDAGHILGAGSLLVTDINARQGSREIIFSGDLGNTPQDIVRPTEYFWHGDYVVMESTYGDRSHPQENVAELIQKEINAVEKIRGTLIIPSFAVERTQDLLYIIKMLKKQGKVSNKTPIFLDSPLAIAATKIYTKYPQLFNSEFKKTAQRENPFTFPNLHMVEKAQEHREIKDYPGPKVIIAGSGMMDGGRVVAHAGEYLARENTRLLFVGYQAEETLGREILEGARNVFIEDRKVTVRATISEISALSAHADQRKLIEWLSYILGVKSVYLVHGDNPAREVLAKKIKNELHVPYVFLPKYKEEFEI